MTVQTKVSPWRKILTIVGISVLISIVVYFGIAFTLIAIDAPNEYQSEGGSIEFSDAIEVDYSTLPATKEFLARDGEQLPYRLYEGNNDRLIVLVHGSGWHGMQFHPMAEAFVASGLGTVVVPDLRGHGEHPERRGDVEYIGQLEDDLADLILEFTNANSYKEVVLGGHSSGGGLAIRFAGGEHGDLIDSYVLMAPYVQYNSPTTRPDSGGWANPATLRIVGLTMLNNVGITALNSLPAISFDMPAEVLEGPYGHTATTSYSFRLNTGFAPRADYQSDIRALDVPFLLIVGEADEAFYPQEYVRLFAAETSTGTYVILPNLNHIAVTTDLSAIEAIAEWVK